MIVMPIIKKVIVCSHYYNKNKTFVLRMEIQLKIFCFTIKKVPLLNMSNTLSDNLKHTVFDLLKNNVKDKLMCESCKKGFNVTNGNGYQPCDCEALNES